MHISYLLLMRVCVFGHNNKGTYFLAYLLGFCWDVEVCGAVKL